MSREKHPKNIDKDSMPRLAACCITCSPCSAPTSLWGETTASSFCSSSTDKSELTQRSTSALVPVSLVPGLVLNTTTAL
jgi:hypothetical protein